MPGDILLDVPAPFSSRVWGWATNTVSDRVAVEYKPISNQTICTVGHSIYRHSNTIGNLILSVYEGGLKPESGSLIDIKEIPNALVPVASSWLYVPFDFTPCLELKSDTTYWFVWTRPFLQYPYGYYSSYKSSDEYPNTSYWAYETFGPYGWTEYPNYEWSFRLEGSDVSSSNEPVIIVPGIFGSRLNRVSDGEEVWPNIRKLALPGSDNFLDELKLDTNGNEVLDMNSSEIIESAAGVIQYGNLIDKFKDNGYQLGIDLFLFPYDWRLDAEVSSLELDTVINQAITQSPTGKVNIIAHSMGGLVVKDYLIRNGDVNINKLIFAGTPHLGAPKAFNALNWGDDFDLRFIGLGLNKNKAKEIAQNMPGAYELLPSREYINRVGFYVQDERSGSLELLTYDQTNQFMTSDLILPDYRNSNILNLADQFHQSHDSWLPQLASVYNPIGCRAYDTIGSFKIEEGGSIDIDSVTGDGTVPFASANYLPSGDKYFVSYSATKINHTGLIRDERTVDLLYHLVTSTDQLTLPIGISQTQDDCDAILNQVKRLRFSTHSPVDLHVYDNSGNHTGLTAEGNIETNIPDSDFIQVGDSSFVFAPDGAEYSVEIDAYATGSFDFKVKELKNGQVDSSLIYEDILINNPDLEASFEFGSIASFSLLSVDENGDGEVDVGYSSDGERILYHGIENVISDINMAYELGWISTKRERDSYLRKLEKVIKIENKIDKIIEKLPDSARRERRIQRLEKKIDRVLAIQFLKDLEKDYNKGRINERAYNLIKEDILWLLEH